MAVKLCGGGQTYDEVRALAINLKLENVAFHERVPLEDLRLMAEKSHLLLGVFGTTEKTRRVIPNKAYQALCLEKPLLTGDTPAARELLVDGENALLCELGDSEAMARSF